MTFIGIDVRGARALGLVLQDMAGRAEVARREVSVALHMSDQASQVLLELSVVQDGFRNLGNGIVDKANLAERFIADPQGTAASMGAPVEALGPALTGLLGFAGPRTLRSVLIGLPATGTDPVLDAALARLDATLLPALLGGEPPAAVELADLQVLALRLGIAHAGPPAPAQLRSGTEVFWQDFWADGRTVDEVLADPGRLLAWVSGTFELDRRLGLATELPRLGDVLATVDFVTGRDSGDLAQLVANTDAEFAAIADYLPAFLVGAVRTAPDPEQLTQTLAFAGRVGWSDPGGTEQERFADAIAFLRANRALQSALLPTGFEGDPSPLAFFNGPGIEALLAMGRRTGVLDDTYLAGLAGLVDQALAALGGGPGADPAASAPLELTQPVQSQLFALVASQVPRAFAQDPAVQAQFIASLGHLRQASTLAEQRRRLIDIVAGFRTLAVAGAPALTERQLVAAVGTSVVDVLGRGRLRSRSQAAVSRNPEFFLVARQWGLPGGRSETIGKYKFSFSFNDLGELTGIRRKKRSWLSRAFDTIKAIGKAIWESWEDNPFKAIFQIGKLALGALSLAVPGLGVAALALGVAETAYHAIEGDWMSAIGAGLSAFTVGAADVFGNAVFPTALQEAQHTVVKGLLSEDLLSFLKNAKRAFDIGTSVARFIEADSLVGVIGAGLGTAATAFGSGGQLLGSLDAVSGDLSLGLVRLGTTLRDITAIVTPAASLVQALEGPNALLAFANGLAVLSAGSRVLANPAGAFSDVARGTDLLVDIDRATRANLTAFSQGTGVVSFVARAIEAADRGDAFRAGSALAAAIQQVNDPNRTVLGDRAQIAQRIADIGATLRAVFASPNPQAVSRLAAPTVLAQFGVLIDAVSTPPKLDALDEEALAARGR